VQIEKMFQDMGSRTLETRLSIFKEDLYLVLWVEWKDGIAYQVASGEVIAAKWENLEGFSYPWVNTKPGLERSGCR
jgi:hypothetical protein